MRHFVNHFDSAFFGQHCHGLVSTQAVGFCVVLIGQFGDFPLAEQLGKHFLWLSPYNKEPAGNQHMGLYHKVSSFQVSLQTELPGVEFPEAKVQFFESPDEEPAAVDTNTFVVEVRVQDEHWVQLLAVSESCHQRRIVMQPQSLAEPVNRCMTHF